MISRGEELGQFDPVFSRAVERSIRGEELTLGEVEALLLARNGELPALTMAADLLRKRLVGDVVTYVVNRNLNFSNVCYCNCSFCGFARDAKDPDAYLLTADEIRRKVREAREYGATEICAQGGINQAVDLDYLLGLIRTVREEMPSAHIHAFSPMEIDHVSRMEGTTTRSILKTLIEAGLGSMPGTAAEVLVDRVREAICPRKISSARWEEIIVEAHELGLPTTSTMMYGTVETVQDRAAHMLKIREIQERTGGFTEFVPLPFVHGNSPISRLLPGGPTGADDIRVTAAARLVLGTLLPNVQVSWVKMGLKLAQVGLACGANDLGGTLMEENISRSAGGASGSLLSPGEMRRMIRNLGRTPMQRDTLYRALE